MFPDALPYVPSSDTGRIELLSDQTSPRRDELQEAERTIFADDRIVSTEKRTEDDSQHSDPMLLDSESLGGIYSPLKGIDQPPSSPPIVRRSLRNRKVEVPLVPLSPSRSEQPAPWENKNVSFQEVLTEVTQDLPPPMPNPENVSSDDIDAFFEETIRPIAAEADRRIDQEQLEEADTVLRVPVPTMDFSKPIALWENQTKVSNSSDQESWKETMSEIKTLHFSNHDWPLSGKAERQLKWTPFPAALGKVQDEQIDYDDALLEEYIAQPDRVDVYTLTWKPEGLRLLDELAESDEELEEGDFPEDKDLDLDLLVRKRKYELQVDESSSLTVNKDSRAAEKRIRDSHGHRGQLENHVEPLLHTFSALNALDSFMGVRKGEIEKPRLTADQYFPDPPKAADLTASLKITKDPDTQHSIQEDVVSIPSPNFVVPISHVSFVVPASFLKNRNLARHIQRLYPSADFIERDFNLYSEPHLEPPLKGSAPIPTKGSMVDEADMLLSPSAGLIWTTLQKIKQRSLPGQVARSFVKERITSASLRYEKLVILVHEGRVTTDSEMVETVGLDNSDCEVFIELVNFCSRLHYEVQVTFVAGGEEDLAKWIVSMMVKYGVSDPNLKLIQDETHWEVFLRRAGMNAFAAQAILSDLKEPSGRAEGDSSGDYGLTAFVKMTVEERSARYETLLGGRQLLARVSRVLDARW